MEKEKGAYLVVGGDLNKIIEERKNIGRQGLYIRRLHLKEFFKYVKRIDLLQPKKKKRNRFGFHWRKIYLSQQPFGTHFYLQKSQQSYG